MIFDKKTLKFMAVGVLNTLVGSGLMFVLYNVFHMGYWASSAANYIVGSVVSFFLNKYWTFNVRKWSLFMVMAYVVVIVVSWLAAYRLSRELVFLLLREKPQAFRENCALLAGMCVFTGLNYLGQRYIVFAARKNGAN